MGTVSDQYYDECSESVGNIELPREAECCSLISRDDVSHVDSIASSMVHL